MDGRLKRKNMGLAYSKQQLLGLIAPIDGQSPPLNLFGDQQIHSLFCFLAPHTHGRASNCHWADGKTFIKICSVDLIKQLCCACSQFLCKFQALSTVLKPSRPFFLFKFICVPTISLCKDIFAYSFSYFWSIFENKFKRPVATHIEEENLIYEIK